MTVSLDALDDETFTAMNDVGFPVARVLAGIDAAAAAELTPVKINMVVKRGVNDDRSSRWPSTSAAPATSCGSSSTWTSAPPTAGGWTTSSQPPRSASDQRTLAARAASAQLPGRGREPLPLPRRGRRDRRHRLGHPAVLRRLHPGAALGRRQALHLPVRRARPRPARIYCAAAPTDRSSPARCARHGHAAPTATQSSARPHAGAAQDRDVLHRRLTPARQRAGR